MKTPESLSLWTRIADWVAPPRCRGCGVFCESVLCPICRRAWEAEKASSCPDCGCSQIRCRCLPPLPRHTLSGAFHLVSYRAEGGSGDVGKKLILASKEWLDERLARFLASQLAGMLRQSLPLGAGWAVAFAPRSPASKRTAGYDQAERIAKYLAEVLALPLIRPLIHLRGGKRQKQLSSAARIQQAARLYQAHPRRIQAAARRHILLVDDVFTTGATLSACATLLRSAGGAASVYAVTVGKTELRQGNSVG